LDKIEREEPRYLNDNFCWIYITRKGKYDGRKEEE
jgi:hypothetical protein